VLYLGRSLVGAFAETLLRTPKDRDLLWSRAEQKRQAVFRVSALLQLANLHGEGLAWFGVTAAQIAACDYACHGTTSPQTRRSPRRRLRRPRGDPLKD
jgi:hypothetical protein